eukprot:Skav205808  [mRNA]  locus=scaffold307:308742:319003:- [translate_table: standard]
MLLHLGSVKMQDTAVRHQSPNPVSLAYKAIWVAKLRVAVGWVPREDLQMARERVGPTARLEDFAIVDDATPDGPHDPQQREPTEEEKKVLRQFRHHWTAQREDMERLARPGKRSCMGFQGFRLPGNLRGGAMDDQMVDRFFNIIDVVRDQRRGGLLDLLRRELCAAKTEAKAMGQRPRVISGGGDGTASFTLFILFAALRADDSRADEAESP